jgi:hypothetical protein
MTRWLAPCGVVAVLCGMIAAAPAAEDDPWAAYRFLIGQWTGEGQGQPGKAAGRFSFALDLQGKVLLRKHRADVAAAAGRPAATHEDLLVIYRGSDGKRTRAMYFDSEDHVIAYTVSPSADGKSVAFVSDAVPTAPRFRLSYAQSGADTVRIKFEMAPPGQPENFRTYVEGTARRQAASAGGVQGKK